MDLSMSRMDANPYDMEESILLLIVKTIVLLVQVIYFLLY